MKVAHRLCPLRERREERNGKDGERERKRGGGGRGRKKQSHPLVFKPFPAMSVLLSRSEGNYYEKSDLSTIRMTQRITYTNSSLDFGS